jgi:transketolase
MNQNSLDQLAVNTIRTLSMDAVQKANSGHPGMPMGMADVAYVLWSRFLKHNPKNPTWVDRDRFILSAGHGSMLLYSLLHLSGYDLSLDDIKNFRQLDSKTPGHPEFGHTVGVEVTTGPLGQGFATGVGMAIAETFTAARFNNDKFSPINHYTYAIVSDGDLMEGISHEAASLAGHLKLGKLIYLYDSNNISIDGSTDLSYTEDAKKRFEAYGWHVSEVDGHDRDAIEVHIKQAQSVTDKPSLVICKTHIGFGSPSKQDSASSHGAPLGADEIVATKKALGWNPEHHFHVPSEVYSLFEERTNALGEINAKWDANFADYTKHYPEVAKVFNDDFSGKLPDNLDDLLPLFEASEKGEATRKASGKVINAIAKAIPSFLGGSADLTGSVNTLIEGEDYYTTENRAGQNMHYGVREHGMAAAMNGMSLHGGVIPYAGTFLVFADYNRPAIRLAALMEIPVIHVFTHDSIGLGEDGPTHQPVEHLASLRAMPNVTVLRPSDANETAWAWKAALANKKGPSLLVLTRQNLPIIERNADNAASNVLKGAYVAKKEEGELNLILMATGSELSIAFEAAKQLKEQGNNGVRIVSIPSFELFNKQSNEYKEQVLPSNVENRISIEAATTFGWHQYVGSKGIAIGLDTFGASTPYEQLYAKFGLTKEAIIEAANSFK